METSPTSEAQTADIAATEILEDLPEWKLDSTFQHRVNNVCTKLLRKGVRPTYQRLRANMGKSPARLLREALQNWTAKVLPDLYTAPKVEWADRPKAISPRVAELFEEMWLQAVSAAQVHYELGDDSGARLTHRELNEVVCLELRRLNARVCTATDTTKRLDNAIEAQNESFCEMRAETQSFLRALELEIATLRDFRSALDETLSSLRLESERQSALFAKHLDVCREIQRLKHPRTARVNRMAATPASAAGRRVRRRSTRRPTP